MGWTLSFLSAVCSFLSSIPVLLWTFLTFLRGVPFPLLPVCQHFWILRISCLTCPHVEIVIVFAEPVEERLDTYPEDDFSRVQFES
jgi:hypothetical protein